MLTIFTIPKPFTDQHINIIQRNAIKSWTLLDDCEVILVGNDDGVLEIAKEFDLKHIPNVKCNEFGTPLLDSAFDLVKKFSKNNLLTYINSDIILFKNFTESLKLLPKDNLLGVGRRWDLDIKTLIDYNDPQWEKILLNNIKNNGKLHSPAGIDYFIFSKNSFGNLPSFAVGRVRWDNWMIYEARRKKMTVIDATEFITIIHQNHNYSGINSEENRKTNPEAKNNTKLAGNKSAFTIEDANWKITKNGFKKRKLCLLSSLKRHLRSKKII